MTDNRQLDWLAGGGQVRAAQTTTTTTILDTRCTLVGSIMQLLIALDVDLPYRRGKIIALLLLISGGGGSKRQLSQWRCRASSDWLRRRRN